MTLSADEGEELLKRLDGFDSGDGFGPGVESDWRAALSQLELDDEVAALLAASLNPGDALVALWHVLVAARRDRNEAWEATRALERRLAETESKLEMSRAASAQMRSALLLAPVHEAAPVHEEPRAAARQPRRSDALDSIVASVLGKK
jgi:hypothetical protein